MTSPEPHIDQILQRALSLAIHMWSDAGNIRYRSPNPLPLDLRELITDNKAALVARLTAWDATEAIRLEIAADGIVEQLHVSGRDAAIQQAAAECVVAHRLRDLASVRDFCQKIEIRARELSGAIPRAA
jgi:hypothetical protein